MTVDISSQRLIIRTAADEGKSIVHFFGCPLPTLRFSLVTIYFLTFYFSLLTTYYLLFRNGALPRTPVTFLVCSKRGNAKEGAPRRKFFAVRSVGLGKF